MNNKLVFFIVGFAIGLVISFFFANSQYQNRTSPAANEAASSEDMPPDHPPVDSPEAKAAISKSSMGPLEAFGAKKAAGEDNDTPSSPAEKAYKNIQVLKGLPANQVLLVMKSFTEGLGVKCGYCHSSVEAPEKDDKPTKGTARKMLQMVREINKNYPTEGNVTCFTCHRGSAQPSS